MDSGKGIIAPLQLTGNVAEKWTSWRQRFEIYSTATELNKKAEKVQCAQLLHLMGDECIKIFNTFQFTEEEKDKIEPLKVKFKNYFVPKSNKVYERYKFLSMRQQHGQTTEEYIRGLKGQVTNCLLEN